MKRNRGEVKERQCKIVVMRDRDRDRIIKGACEE